MKKIPLEPIYYNVETKWNRNCMFHLQKFNWSRAETHSSGLTVWHVKCVHTCLSVRCDKGINSVQKFSVFLLISLSNWQARQLFEFSSKSQYLETKSQKKNTWIWISNKAAFHHCVQRIKWHNLLLLLQFLYQITLLRFFSLSVFLSYSFINHFYFNSCIRYWCVSTLFYWITSKNKKNTNLSNFPFNASWYTHFVMQIFCKSVFSMKVTFAHTLIGGM